MKFDFLTQAAKFLQERKEYKRWLAVFMCLAVAVTFGTVAALKMYGQAMTHQVKVLECQYQVHTHTDDCYEKDEDGNPTGDPVCGYADYVVHVHNDDCYDENGNLVCPLEEIEKHEHDDGCYEEKEVLVCEEGESEGADGHTHTDACYTEVKGDLICEASEEGGHTHDESCYSKTLTCDREEHSHDEGCYEKELVCDNEDEDHEHGDGCYKETLVCDKEEHTHGDDCYSEELTCGQEEAGGHEHTDECYETKKELTCTEGESESTDGHTHDGDCYKTEKVLTCDKLELHTHTEALEEDGGCYDESAFDEDGEFIEGSRPVCGIPQLEEHVHTAECFKTVELTGEEVAQLNAGGKLHVHDESCYDEEGNLICEIPSVHVHGLECYDEDGNLICGSGWAHTHDESCYDADGNLICGQEEIHVHSESCYDEDGNLICGYEEKEAEEDHEHDANCYDADGNLTCGHEDAKEHEHDAKCYDEEGNLTCGYEGVKNHEHSADCYDIKDNLICGYEGVEDHVHSEACYDVEGNLICGYEMLTAYDNSKIFECDDYVIVARYNEDAHIPAEAELLAEKITPETDGEHYAQREAEYQEILGDENASMRALLKIGFYLDGEAEGEKVEIEPETPVEMSIQFLDEDGLPEGSPITVVHFAEEGTEKLDGSKAKNSSTTFEMKSFSEVAIGCGPREEGVKVNKDGTLHISNDFACEADPFHIVFHVEGDAKSRNGSPIVGALPEAAKADGGEGTLPKEEETGDTLQPDADVAESDEAGADGEAGSVDGTASTDGDTPADENVPSPQLNFYVKSLDGDTELRESLMDYLGESTEEVNRNILHMIFYQMTYGDVKLDLSDCVVTAEITLDTAVPVPESKETDPENGTGNEAGAAEENPAEDQDESGIPDGEPAEDQDESGAADEEQTEGAEAANTVSDGLVIADQEQGNAENVKVTSQNTAVVNEITENREEIQAFKDLLADEDEETEISVMAIGVSDGGQVSRLGKMELKGGVQTEAMSFAVNNQTMAMAAEARTEQIFTVQYYTYLPIAAREETVPTGATGIPIINTSAEANGGKAKLPANGVDPVLTNLIVAAKEDGSTGPISAFHEVKAENSLKKIYKDAEFDFAYYPKLENFNKFADEYRHYDLKEVWVLKDGKDPASENAADWTVYKNLQQLEFTNNSQYVEDHPDTAALVKRGTVIRLVSESNTGGANYNAVFYDYDITNGKVYSDSKLTKLGDRNSTGTLYAGTNRQGINAVGNYEKLNQKPNYGFGNFNVGGTGLNNDRYQEYFINRSTQHADSGNKKAYEGCSFGIVESQLDSEGLPVFNMDAPKIFGPESQNGKTIVPGYSLDFKRQGDTYTLTSVNDGTNTTKNLDLFQCRDRWGGGKLWTNNFWAMDTSKDTYGTDGHDLKFGDGNKEDLRKAVGKDSTATFPTGDDGKDHNCYFGMQFAVEFTLTEDYLGPLNYYFFGDDDMWVFLDGNLICDIGGVHSSSGAYVDLWDYIVQGDARKHELRFFYTERGASGSTCWMQFTLPSVNTVPINYPVGSVKNTLKINKDVTGTDTGQKFKFGINFYDKDVKDGGKALTNYYAYTIVNGGKEIEAGSIKTGESFFLGNGDSIIIQNLPDGAMYVVMENEYSGYESEINGIVEKDRTAEGFIDWTKDDAESYINKSLPYNLPETGGPGPIWYMIASAFFITLGAGLICNKKFSERRV